MISARLLKIAEMIEKDKVVFDVGSDHALLPCFLLAQGISKKVYAGEIASGPLQRAKDNIQRYHLQGQVIPVLSDGLEHASEDVQIVVIAGMGYHTIRHILENCDVSKYDYFVVQSNTEVEALRAYLSEKHYTILDEKMVFDGFYYQIISFNGKYHEAYDQMQINYGPILLKNKDEVFLSYLKYNYEKLKKINESAHKKEFEEKMKEIDKLLYNLSL